MPEKTKITLSDKELSLLKNVDWILTKQNLIQKVFDLFADSTESIKLQVLSKPVLPDNIRFSVPKIFKGENYLQLPYVIMDYPRCFEKENIFAVRTMFWWGHFFSITLHVSGIYKRLVKEHLYSTEINGNENIFIGVNEDQWQHHFEENNFLPYTSITKEERIALFEKNDFVKLAMKFDLDQWNEIPELFNEGYKRIASMLA